MMLQKGMYLQDRYEILESVGAGGMSDVYKAKDHVLNREVAIKVLKKEFTEDMSFVTKFRREAQSAAVLEHPNIVNIYDVGSEDGLYFIIMEYIEGITLKSYIERKERLNYKEVLSIAIQVGRGIQAAHEKGIIHRDIKPQNVIISKEGKVKVTDFGIAKAVSSNTINAEVMGSVHYTSPEQARNGMVNCQTDIYSLGIVMYEMITGRVPYDGDTTVAIAIQHLQSDIVPPSHYVEDIPISVEKIILKCTMKSTDKRYENMEDLLLDLKKALVNPDEDFVVIAGAVDNVESTRVITAEELDAIKKEAGVIDDKATPKKIDEDDEKSVEGKVNPKMDKAITIMAIIAAVVVVGVLVYFIGSGFGWWKFFGGDSNQESEQVTMVDLTGLTEKEAINKLKELKLGYKKEEVASDQYPEGQVCGVVYDGKNVKKGDKIPANSTVTLQISTGKGDTDVPNVVGQTESSAINAIKAAGFKHTVNYEYSDKEQGKVINQSPGANSKAKSGDTITITVSQGSEKAKVPSVVGQSQSSATAALSAAGLNVTVSTESSDSVASGNVISQSIDSGKYVEKGTTVNITVSSGKKTTYYRYSGSVTGPGVGSLKDANGSTLYTTKNLGDNQTESFSVSNITTSTGTLYYPNGSSEAVNFTPM
ncbi:MAG TPA: Stk1 family PASTA domain-containing Ser/Thr kinase [Lachnospiraceae bacterium]|nr:Stk1 family PASTA domain-containing Ser/Thr kinase [Lachnospiraceae bacterium]